MQVRVLRLKNKGKKCPQQQCPAVASYLLQNVNKKKFGPNFLDATFLPALLQKRSDMFMLFLLGLRAIQIKFKTVHQSIFLENSREKLTIIAL